MGTEKDKAKTENNVFREFLEQTKLKVDTFDNPGKESEPDILCKMTDGEEIYFELVEICEQDLAKDIFQLRKGKVELIEASSRSNPTNEVIHKKLKKEYITQLPIELICYTSGRVIPPDDIILEEACKCANSTKGPFRKIWLLGEKNIYEVWPTCQLIAEAKPTRPIE